MRKVLVSLKLIKPKEKDSKNESAPPTPRTTTAEVSQPAMMENSEDASRKMTKEEEDEWDMMVRQRRNARSGGFYGGNVPHPSTLEADFTSKSSGFSEPNCSKHYDKVLEHSSRFRIGYAETIGKRPTMEDEIRVMGRLRSREEDYVAVFDGHGGKEVSEFAAAHLHKILAKKLDELSDAEESLKQAFSEMNEMIKTTNKDGGTTALVALITEKKVYIANVGDSRAVLHRDSDSIGITIDHKPDVPSEEQRIQKGGGTVTRTTNKQGKTICRVNGMLAVSRALGDILLQPHVSPEPEIFEFDLNDTNKYLIMACDGVWDVLSNEDASALAASEDNPETSAIKIRDTALSRGSGDNISVVVVQFPGGRLGQNQRSNSRSKMEIETPTNSGPANGGWPISAITVVVVVFVVIGALAIRTV